MGVFLVTTIKSIDPAKPVNSVNTDSEISKQDCLLLETRPNSMLESFLKSHKNSRVGFQDDFRTWMTISQSLNLEMTQQRHQSQFLLQHGKLMLKTRNLKNLVSFWTSHYNSQVENWWWWKELKTDKIDKIKYNSTLKKHGHRASWSALTFCPMQFLGPAEKGM